MCPKRESDACRAAFSPGACHDNHLIKQMLIVAIEDSECLRMRTISSGASMSLRCLRDMFCWRPRGCTTPSRLSVEEAHEELVQGLHVQFLLEGQLILEEGPSHNAAAQEIQRACFYGLMDRPGCPLCTRSSVSGRRPLSLGRSKAGITRNQTWGGTKLPICEQSIIPNWLYLLCCIVHYGH